MNTGCGRGFIVMSVITLVGVTSCSGPIEQKYVTSGSFNSLMIGQSKRQTFAATGRMGGNIVTATHCPEFSVTGANPDGLKLINDVEGMQLQGTHGETTDVTFARGHVSSVKSNGHESLAPTIEQGDTLDEVREKTAVILAARPDLVAKPLLFKVLHHTVNLDAMSAEDEKIIQLCDEWDFEVASVKPAGAFYSLKFEGDKLSAISYRRARVRVD